MTFKVNIDPTGRDFFYNPAGNDDFDGRGLETAVSSPQKAVELVNALIPTPGPSDPASITASVTGTYAEGVILPQYTTCNAASASILTFDPVNVTCMGRQTVVWGSLLNFSANGTVVLIDGRTRVSVEVNAAVPIGVNSIGFDIKGSCDSIFVQLRLGEIQGIEAIMFNHTATSPIPVSYEIEICQFFNTDQTLIKFNPPNATDQANFEIGSIQRDLTARAAGATDGSVALHAMFGRLIVEAQVIDADSIAIVEGGAEFSLDCQVGIGDIFVDVGSNAIINIGLMLGDLTIDGSAHGVINQYVGTITINGVFNGIINGVRYGNWIITYEQLLMADDFTTQTPTGLDTNLQVLYGGVQAGSVLSLDALGNVTCHVTGQYKLTLRFQFGRTGAGGAAYLYFRVLIDGAQVGDSEYTKLDGMNDDLPVNFVGEVDLVANEVLTVEIVRDSAGGVGMDDGNLFPGTPTAAGWNNAPSAQLILSRLL